MLFASEVGRHTHSFPTQDLDMKASGRRHREKHNKESRRGVIAVFAAILMVFVLGIVAFAIDCGYVANTRGEIQRAVDAGALAGAQLIGGGPAAAEPVAREFVSYNPTGASVIPDTDVDVEFGSWDVATKTFNEGGIPTTAIRVAAVQRARPHFFAPIWRERQFDVRSQAIATYQPRDIVVVLDYSASMNDDSELKHVWQLGQPAIEANLLQIYNELGAPQYGSMNFTPQFIASTNPLVIMQQLGLNGVPYPYPSGSWYNYFNYVQNNWAIQATGYQRRYGYLTLVNYWLHSQPKYSQTPDLWKTSEQPVTAVKDAFDVFLSYIQASPTDDRVGLVVYTSSQWYGCTGTQLDRSIRGGRTNRAAAASWSLRLLHEHQCGDEGGA